MDNEEAVKALDDKHGLQGWDIYRSCDRLWHCNIKGEENFSADTIMEALAKGAAFDPLPRFPRAPVVLRVEDFGEPYRDGSKWRCKGIANAWTSKKRAVAAVAAMCDRSRDIRKGWEQTTGIVLERYRGEGIDFRWER